MISTLGLVMFVLTRPISTNKLAERLATDPSMADLKNEPLSDADTLDSVRLTRSLFKRVLAPLYMMTGARLTTLLPSSQITGMRKLIAQAGNPPGKTPAVVLGTQCFSCVALFVAGIGVVYMGALTPPISIGVPILAAVLGFNTPRSMLERTAKKRRKEIEKVLPDMVDLLTVSVEAGLTFESALRKVCEKFDNLLSTEFQKALNEYRLGMPLNSALKEMAERLQVPSLEVVIRVVLQSEQLGTGLGAILRIQSATQRRERRARAEELGQKAPIKMLLPMVGCIFPTIFIVLLGPAVIQVFSQHS
jgi:tight adherence protein C